MLSFLFENIISGIIVGVVANTIFLLTLSRLRPKVSIGPQIARREDRNTGKIRYRIKITNRTRTAITDIKATLDLMWPQQEVGGIIYRSKTIPLVGDAPIAIERFSARDSDANYAYRFSTDEPIDELWENDSQQFLRFRITCRHSLSGFGGFFIQDFHLKRQAICDGSFSKGDTFEIV